MKLEKGKKYQIEELKLFPEWELKHRGANSSVEIKPVGKEFYDKGLLVTQQILDSWTIEEVKPKLQTGYYTTERLKDEVVYRVKVSEEREIEGWIALDLIHPQPHLYNSTGGKLSDTSIEDLIEEGLIPCKISVELLG